MTDYNPYILGFVEQGGRSGDVWLPLQEAIETFGDLPSRYGLLPEVKVRRQSRTLILALGSAINTILGRAVACVACIKSPVEECSYRILQVGVRSFSHGTPSLAPSPES